jgi:hypothetical protein
MSSFADLANPHEARVEELKDGSTKVVLEGGDAGDSYDCVIRIKKGRVISRRVSDGEFPDNFFEETTYTMIPYID